LKESANPGGCKFEYESSTIWQGIRAMMSVSLDQLTRTNRGGFSAKCDFQRSGSK